MEPHRNRMRKSALLSLSFCCSAVLGVYIWLCLSASLRSRCSWEYLHIPFLPFEWQWHLRRGLEAFGAKLLLGFAGSFPCLGTLGLWRLSSYDIGIGYWLAGYILSLPPEANLTCIGDIIDILLYFLQILITGGILG